VSELTFANASLFAWLTAATVAAAVVATAWRLAARRRQGSIGMANPDLVRSWHPGLAWTRWALAWAGLALVVVAMGGPRWGSAPVMRTGTGANIVLLLDCSRSMLAEDLYPNRLEAARRKAIDLLASAPEHRMAIMPFAAIAVLRCPLSGDRLALEQMLQDCRPELFPVASGLQGTAIGAAVEDAIEVLSDNGDRGRAIVVCSDGSDPDRDRLAAAAERARSAGIPVYGLFLGDPDVETSLVLDGQERPMPADRSSLDLLADRTDAICVNATSNSADVEALAEHIRNNVTRLPWEERSRTMATERYLWPLVPGILLLAAAALLPTRRRRSRLEVPA